MNAYDEQLHSLQAQCARKRKLEAVAAELGRQRASYAARARELEAQFREEQDDVDRLEGRSLSAFFYQVIGKMDEKLTKEKREAYAAKVKYDAVAQELAGIEADLRECQAELEDLQDCEERYAAALQSKAQAIKASGSAEAQTILQLEVRVAYLESQKRELDEARSAGLDALATVDQIFASLKSAEGWGTWDLVGGGVLSDVIKHGHLDDAQTAVETLQSQLRRFRTELTDVTIDAEFQISIDGFLRVADYIFDGIFADWAVLDQIHQSQSQVLDVRNQIEGVLEQLDTMQRQTDAEQSRLHQEIEAQIRSASV